jgi:hypothetical protein
LLLFHRVCDKAAKNAGRLSDRYVRGTFDRLAEEFRHINPLAMGLEVDERRLDHIFQLANEAVARLRIAGRRARRLRVRITQMILCVFEIEGIESDMLAAVRRDSLMLRIGPEN